MLFGNSITSCTFALSIFYVLKNLIQEQKESKRRKTSSLRSEDSNAKSESPKPKGVQLSIKEYYRSAKMQAEEKPGDLLKTSASQDDEKSKGKRDDTSSSSNLTKSARRRLLFD